MRIHDNACKAHSTVPDGKWQLCCDWNSYVILCVHLRVWELEVSSTVKFMTDRLIYLGCCPIFTCMNNERVSRALHSHDAWRVVGEKRSPSRRTFLLPPVKSQDSVKYIPVEWCFVPFRGLWVDRLFSLIRSFQNYLLSTPCLQISVKDTRMIRHMWPLFKDTYSGRGSKKPTDNFTMRQGRPSPRTGKMDGLSPWPWCIWCRLVPEAHCWVFLVSLHGMEEGDDICFGIGVVLKFKYVEACSTVTSGYLSPQWCGNGKDASAMHGSFFLTRPLLGTFCEYISLLLLL